ncbi:MAG: 16S rRNA (cytosine(1402)-N(4))-methyltransferase RsmH [Dehalococcoidia bacterium]
MASSPSASTHVPVMVEELVRGLQVIPGGLYVDATVGGGGHAEAVLEACAPGGKLLGIDADPRAIRAAERWLGRFKGTYALANDNFANLRVVCAAYGFSLVNGVYFDLGLSSAQLEEPRRGFSFQREADLDMRFSDRQQVTAADIVNTYSMNDLAKVLWTYGEEPRSRAIARSIVAHRPLKTTTELAHLVESVVRGRKRIHPATKTFQALRICVNDELASLEQALRQTTELLGTGGRVAVISYHSLEDRATKQWFRRESIDCLCPPGLPVCVCGHTPTLRLVTRRVVTPSEEEVKRNPRSRSAKLRIAERI